MKYCLLDHLAEHVNVHYISELKVKDLVKPYASYISSIQNDLYSLADWKDTCDYLLQNCENIESIEDAKKRILDWLQA